MRDSLNALRRRYDSIAIPTIHVAFALSLMLHALMLLGWLPKLNLRPADKIGEGKSGTSLAVRLAPPPAAAPAPPPAPSVQASRAPQSPAHSAAAPKAAPRVLATERPSPSRTAPPPVQGTSAQLGTDLASFIEARRRARESPAAPPPSRSAPPTVAAAPTETAQERDNRLAAINLGLNRTPSFGDEKKQGGGIFQIARMGYSDAEFFFFGWNKAINRNSRQMIEVRRGDNPNMEIAVVRRMIAIIRDHERGDFIWESRRLGRDVSLSARDADNAGLEDFMMQEFFPYVRPRN